MRINHNKKRNTAFLYECLIRELTTSILKKNTTRKRATLGILKEFFLSNTILKEELSHYNMVLSEHSLQPAMAERLLWEVRSKYFETIDKNEVFKVQSDLIRKINTSLGKDVYNNFVPNYKQLATMHAIFNVDLGPKDKVLLESKVIQSMMSPANTQVVDDTKEPIDNLVYKSFVKKFNDLYGDSLLKEQKDLVSRYIVSFHDNNVGLKIYLNEEVGRLHSTLLDCKDENYIKEDSDMIKKVNRVIGILESFQKKTIDTGLVEDVLRIQQLAHEMQAP